MKPLLRFLYVIFYIITSALIGIFVCCFTLLIPLYSFFYYIFTGKNFFNLNSNDIFFIKIYNMIEKFIDRIDPDYKEPNEIDNKTNYIDNKTNYIIDSEYKNYNNLNKYIVHYNKGLKYYLCIAHDIDEAITITKNKFGNNIEIKWVELSDNVEKINALINLENENDNSLYEYHVYYIHDNESYIFKTAALNENDAKNKTMNALRAFEDIKIYDIIKV